MPDAIQTGMIRAIDKATGAALGSISGIAITTVNEGTFTLGGPASEMAAHMQPGTIFEVAIRTGNKTNRWRSESFKVDAESGVLTLEVKKVV